MNRITVVIITLLLVCFGGVLAYSIHETNAEKKKDEIVIDGVRNDLIVEASEQNGNIGDHVRGNANSKVVVVEYADYECPGCASFAPRLDNIYEDYKDDVAFVFRNFPLKMHANARAASAAAEAAGLQGYFWEMYDTIYSNRNSWMDLSGSARTDAFVELFAGVAKDGDIEKFRSDLSNEDVLRKIDFDYKLGLEADKVSATPSVHINGEAVNIQDLNTFDEVETRIRETINEELKKSEESTESGESKKEEEPEATEQ